MIFKRILKQSILIALLVGANQNLPAAEPVTLDSCRSLALTHNKQLQIGRERINKARYQRQEAFAAYLPSIDFSGGYVYNQKNLSIFDSDQLLPVKEFDLQTQSYQFNVVKNPMTGEPIMTPDGQYIPSQVALIPKEAMEFDIHNVFFGAITLTQPVYMGGKIVAMNRITRYAEELANAMSNSEAENIIYAVDAAYWQVVSLKAKKELAESYVALLDTLRSNVKLMVAEGVATQSDLLSVEVKYNEAEVDLTKVENGLVLSRMALAQICGQPINTVMPLKDEGINDIGISDAVATSYDINDVYARRQDLESLRLGVKIMEQKARVELASMLPNVVLIGSYSFSNPNMFNGFKNRFDGAFSVGAMVTIPIWHWGGNYNKYRAAKTQAKITGMELDDARDKVELQVSQAAFKAREAVKAYNMTLGNVESAQSNLDHARYGFAEGVMTSQNVMEAQTAWLKAHSEKIDAMIDVKLCDVYLSKVLGTLQR